MRLILALDVDHPSKALRLIDQVDPSMCALKVGLEMYTRWGSDWVKTLIQREFKVFLDLKFHDIPHTVAAACRAAADLGVWMTNVHALGGLAMMEAAWRALEPYGIEKPILIAVTLLTSMAPMVLPTVGLTASLASHIRQLACLSQQAGLDGVVCSAHDVMEVKAACGKGFKTVTPGIRLSDEPNHDQARIATPEQALAWGSDYLVVGRSITQSPNPQAKIQAILNKIT